MRKVDEEYLKARFRKGQISKEEYEEIIATPQV